MVVVITEGNTKNGAEDSKNKASQVSVVRP